MTEDDIWSITVVVLFLIVLTGALWMARRVDYWKRRALEAEYRNDSNVADLTEHDDNPR